jgi:hypothetical protein
MIVPGAANWSEVPRAAVGLYEAAKAISPDTGRVYWHPTSGMVTLNKRAEASIPVSPPPMESNQSHWFYPNALAASLGGGILGAGLGYGGGYLLNKLLPDEYFDEEDGSLPQAGALLGGVTGALPGLLTGAISQSIPAAQRDNQSPWLSSYPFNRPLGDKPNLVDSDPFKKASYSATGFGEEYSIPKDAFNRVIWDSVTTPPNPWGTKSMYGTNEQPLEVPRMATPPEVAALFSGALEGASRISGHTESVGLLPLAGTLALSTGTGMVASTMAARGLGWIAGLKPGAQKSMIEAGTMGGFLHGLAQPFFRR